MMIDLRFRAVLGSLTMLLSLLAGVGCEQNESDPKIDYSQEGPNGPDAQSEFTKTASGLQYRILREGTGKKPTAADSVEVSYRGWLDDGTEFDSSYAKGSTIDFGVSGVIPGWTEGLQLIGEGGKIELSIPSDLGYGPGGAGGSVPPNAQLHFVVELHDVVD